MYPNVSKHSTRPPSRRTHVVASPDESASTCPFGLPPFELPQHVGSPARVAHERQPVDTVSNTPGGASSRSFIHLLPQQRSSPPVVSAHALRPLTSIALNFPVGASPT